MKTSREVSPVDELKAVGKTLQDAAITLLQAVSDAAGAVAKDTLTATNAVIAAAEEALGVAKEKLRKAGEELHKRA